MCNKIYLIVSCEKNLLFEFINVCCAFRLQYDKFHFNFASCDLILDTIKTLQKKSSKHSHTQEKINKLSNTLPACEIKMLISLTS